MGLLNVAKSAYQSLKYGKQIGKTSANGCKAFKKGNVITGINKQGEVIRTITTETRGGYTHVTSVKPFFEQNEITSIRRENFRNFRGENVVKYHSETHLGDMTSLPLKTTHYISFDGKVKGGKEFYSEALATPGIPYQKLENGYCLQAIG